MEENQKNLFTIEDVWAERDNNQPSDPKKKYDPQYFWDNYGERYFKSFDKREKFQFGLTGQNPVAWLIFKLEKLQPGSILEAGCGFARLAPFLIDANIVSEYWGIDFSDKIMKSSEDYLRDYAKKDRVHLQNASAKKMPFSNQSFDIVMTNELLMHMSSTKVDHCLREFRRIARKYIVLVERFVYPGEKPYPHIMSHDLMGLCGNVGLTVLESKLIGSGQIAIILKV